MNERENQGITQRASRSRVMVVDVAVGEGNVKRILVANVLNPVRIKAFRIFQFARPKDRGSNANLPSLRIEQRETLPRRGKECVLMRRRIIQTQNPIEDSETEFQVLAK